MFLNCGDYFSIESKDNTHAQEITVSQLPV
jgi:hypothetical protein